MEEENERGFLLTQRPDFVISYVALIGLSGVEASRGAKQQTLSALEEEKLNKLINHRLTSLVVAQGDTLTHCGSFIFTARTTFRLNRAGESEAHRAADIQFA